MAAQFGAGPLMDAFAVAFRIPNLFRNLFGEGAMTTAFLPLLVREQEQQGPPSARNLASAVFISLGLFLSSAVFLCELFLGVLWCCDLSPDNRMAVELLMLLLPYLVFVCLSAQQAVVLHSLGKFLWPALLPVVLNVVWLIAIPLTLIGEQTDAVRLLWICGAIMLSGLLQLAIPWGVLRCHGYGLTRQWRSAMPKVRAHSRRSSRFCQASPSRSSTLYSTACSPGDWLPVPAGATRSPGSPVGFRLYPTERRRLCTMVNGCTSSRWVSSASH